MLEDLPNTPTDQSSKTQPEAYWSHEFNVVLPSMDPLLVETPEGLTYSGQNVYDVLTIEDRQGTQNHIIGTRLPMAKCRALNQTWSRNANGICLDMDIIYRGFREREGVELGREGFGWDDYSEVRRVFVFPQEFFDGFRSQGEDTWSLGWQHIALNWLVERPSPQLLSPDFKFDQLEDALKESKNRLYRHVLLVTSEQPLGPIQKKFIELRS